MRDRIKRAIKRRLSPLKPLRDALRREPDGAPNPSEPAAAAPVPPADPHGDDIGPFRRIEVEALMDEMVRPALNMDGGDIELVRVEQGDVHVRLTGACVGCPSSRITLRDGVERLFIEELTGFTSLIEVQAV